MRREDSKRVRRVLTVAAASALAVAAIGIPIGNNARARADAGCSAETIRGAYALYATGNVAGIPLAAIGRFTFDGAGHSTATMIESYNGLIDDGTLEGTYTLNPDCRGSLIYTMKHYARGTGHAGQAHEYRHEVHTVDIVVASGGQRIVAVVVDTYPMAAPPGAPQTDDLIGVIGWLERM
jgi:hypothetical protein